jgi:aminoglycoside 6'-N-acetyltransferase I
MAEPPVTVRSLTRGDAARWMRMRRALWPEASAADHGAEIDRFFAGDARIALIVLLAEDAAHHPLGFAEVSIRTSAEGCRTNRVAYLEGWFVVPEARRRGVGRALVEAAEAWARSDGCSELASDTTPGNDASIAAHRALGFANAGAHAFRKDL